MMPMPIVSKLQLHFSTRLRGAEAGDQDLLRNQADLRAAEALDGTAGAEAGDQVLCAVAPPGRRALRLDPLHLAVAAREPHAVAHNRERPRGPKDRRVRAAVRGPLR